MRISDWSSDVCSSDLAGLALCGVGPAVVLEGRLVRRLRRLRIIATGLQLPAGREAVDALAGSSSDHPQPPEVLALPVRKRIVAGSVASSEERSVGKGCVMTCRSRWSPYH